MRNALPILICSLFLAACGSHSGDADTANAPSPAAPATAPAAPAPSTSTASASTAATPATSDSAATPAMDDAASDDGSASAPAIDPSKVDFKDTGKWVAGKNYFVISPAQPKVTSTNKVEVVEVFSWGCPACNAYHPLVDSMRKALPDYATMEYLPASFRPDENWVVYQRAFYAAQALGVARKSYDAVFDATWKSGELATYNLGGQGLKQRSDWPGIDAFAKFFAKHYGVNEQQFLGVANSFSINTKMKRADELIKSYGVPSTPNFIVDGKYRFDFQSAGGAQQAIELAQWLVAKEASGH